MAFRRHRSFRGGRRGGLKRSTAWTSFAAWGSIAHNSFFQNYILTSSWQQGTADGTIPPAYEDSTLERTLVQYTINGATIEEVTDYEYFASIGIAVITPGSFKPATAGTLDGDAMPPVLDGSWDGWIFNSSAMQGVQGSGPAIAPGIGSGNSVSPWYDIRSKRKMGARNAVVMKIDNVLHGGNAGGVADVCFIIRVRQLWKLAV